jgi:hypothetical protein
MLHKRNLIPFEYDARMLETYLREGKLNQDQLKSYLAALPDDSANCEKINIDDETLSGNAGYSAESTDDSSDY